MRRALHNLRDGLLGLAYPQACHLCGGFVDSWGDGVSCASCWEDPSITTLFIRPETRQKDGEPPAICQKCGLLLPAVQTFERAPMPVWQAASAPPESPTARTTADKRYVSGRDCGRCQELPFLPARACGAYRGALEASLLFLKSEPHICQRLRRIIGRAVASEGPGLAADVVVPVPLHAARRAERGFNQAELIAALIAAQFAWPLDARLLERRQNTARHRAGMDALDRRRSVARAFAVGDGSRVAGRRILLVDDLFTTGSTLAAATTALLEAGARSVAVFTIARVTPVVPIPGI